MVEGLAEGAQGGSLGPPSDCEKGAGPPGAADQQVRRQPAWRADEARATPTSATAQPGIEAGA